MSQEKKITLYEVNPRYFKDVDGDGIGDLQGLAQKFDYFTFLGVDGVILKDLLSVDSNDERQSFTTVASELGNLNDFVKVLSLAKHRNIKIFVELNLGTIKNNNNWFTALVSDGAEEFTGIVKMINKVSSSNKEEGIEYINASINLGYYAQKEATKEIPLNWKSNIVMKQFIKVIRFWKELGVSGFVFKNFEYVAEEPSKLVAEMLTSETQKELRKFYKAIKEEDENLTIIGRSDVITEEYAESLTIGSKKIIDYFMPTSVSMQGTKNNSIDHIGKFTTKKLAKSLTIMGTSANNIVTFGSSRIGRTVSRWGTDGQFHQEAAKLISIALLLNKASSSIYSGDEIGVKNIGLNHLDDFQDAKLEERKKQTVYSGYSEEKFMSAQVLQNPINAISVFAWNSKKNGGFSTNSQTITPITSSYRYVNVEAEFADKSSILNFNKQLIEVINEDDFAKIITSGNYKASSLQKGILKIRIWNNKHEIMVLLNFTNKTKKIYFPPSSGKVVISTYTSKEYAVDYSIKSLEAYEGVVIAKLTDEYTKETKIRKKTAAKARQIAKREKNELKRYENLLIQETTSNINVENSRDDDKIAKQAELQKISLNKITTKTVIYENEKTIELEARELAKIEKVKLREQNFASEQTRLLNIANEKQLEKQVREQERLEKEKTKQLAIEAKELASLEKEKTKQLAIEAKELARLEKEKTKQLVIDNREKERLEKEKTRQLELETRKQERLEKEKTRLQEIKEQEKERSLQQKALEKDLIKQEKTKQLVIDNREKERLEKEKTRQLELETRKQERSLQEQANERARLAKIAANEVVRLEKEKTRNLTLLEKEKTQATKLVEKKITDVIKTNAGVKLVEKNSAKNHSEKEGSMMKKVFGIFNKKDRVTFTHESSSIDFEKAAKKAERDALREANRLEKDKTREFNRLEKNKAKELVSLHQANNNEKPLVNEIELEKQKILEQQELQAKHARFHGEKTNLVDSQVAKTTQIDVNNVEDVEAYLKDLDSQKK